MMAEGSLTSKSLKAFLALRDKYFISNQSHDTPLWTNIACDKDAPLEEGKLGLFKLHYSDN
jgi:hypothetical protein